MSTNITYTCDVCGKQKDEANHWFMFAENEAATINTSIGGLYFPPKLIVFLPWDQNLCQDDKFGHLCGSGCAASKQQQWIDGEKIPWSITTGAYLSSEIEKVQADLPDFANLPSLGEPKF